MQSHCGIVAYVGTDTIAMIEHYAKQASWANQFYEFAGPVFKPENKYINPGFPLDTTTWYVSIAFGGRRHFVFADNFTECAWNAHRKLSELIEKSE